MWVPRCIVAAISMLVLTATPAVVEGTCHCADVCPNYDPFFNDCPGPDGGTCWGISKHCVGEKFGGLMGTGLCITGGVETESECDGYCVCNTFGCNCDPCDRVPGGCAKTRMFRTQQTHELTDEEEEDECADFRYITSLSPEGKRDFLAEKYCSEDDKVAVQNIFEILRNEVLRKLDGSVLTCALFNESYIDMSHLKLCEDKQQHVVVSLLTTSSSTGNTDGGHSFVVVVVGLLGAAMMAMTVVQRRHRGLVLRRHQYIEVDATTTPIKV